MRETACMHQRGGGFNGKLFNLDLNLMEGKRALMALK